MCGERLTDEMEEKGRGEERKEEEQKREECVFHQVHLVLHSTGDILREIHAVSQGASHTMGSSWVNPPQKIQTHHCKT